MPMRSSDVRWFSQLVLRLHACTSDRALFQVLLPDVHQRFGSIVSQADELAWDQSIFRQHGVHGGLEPPKDYLPASEDHPLVLRLFSTRRIETMHRASLSPWGEFSRTNFYNVLFRPYGIRDQLLSAISAGSDFVACFGVNRDSDFTADEALLMEAVRRHAEACLLRIRRTTDPVATFGTPEILLGHDLRPIGLSRPLRQVLSAYFPGQSASTNSRELPDELRRWVTGALAMLHARPPPAPLAFLRTESARGWLYVRLFPHQPHGHTLRLREELRASGTLAFGSSGMTVRECEVLHWLMAGKRDAEIATILACTVRTVEKHAENVRRKLGTRNRQMTAVLAAHWVQGGSP